MEVLYASFSIVFSATALGNSMGLAPDLVASKFGASNVYALMGRESEIDADKKEAKSMKEIQGGICVEKLYFSYPRRPHVPVLSGLTVEIAKARTLALVGASGHGKSTIISLLERFYWLRDGVISIDGQDISEVRVGDLRSHIGLVSQEAELFNRSVFDNITYGLSHSEGTGVTMSEVIEVAKQANAHDFIQELPQGYDTVVGERGEGLSGGQRQRIAIARSLIRRPKILLLDEATSALDIDSERVVQKALDEAAIGRTTIVVAHRLSTIRNADVIAVGRNGEIVESVKHDELLRRNGAYCELVEHQLTEGVSSQ